MSEELLRTVKNMLASGKGDSKRLLEIIGTIKGGEPILMSDYKYIESLTTQNVDPQPQEKVEMPKQQTSSIKDDPLSILRVRLAEGHITIDEFRELKKALSDG